MLLKKNLLLVLVLIPLLAACEVGGIQLTKPAVFCEFNDQQYQPGETVPAEDGCNTCICSAVGEIDGCTEIACTGLANPAAVKCSVDGFHYEIREDETGAQFGVCIDSEKKECDGWEYLRGTCLLGEVVLEFRGELEDTTGGEASGVATAKYSSEKYFHEVFTKNLPPLEEGFFYEGWLVKPFPLLDVISSGKLVPEGEEGGFALSLEANENLSKHTRVVITLEPDDGDPDPAEHVLEGTMELIQ